MIPPVGGNSSIAGWAIVIVGLGLGGLLIWYLRNQGRAMPENINDYKASFRHKFAELLQKAEAKNTLYYLLNLLNLWGQHGPISKRVGESIDFNVEINLATNALLLDRIRDGRSEPVRPHEILFLIQINMEAKAVYGVIRNFANICRGEWVGQEPWIKGEMLGHGLSTMRIISNVASELTDAGFPDLAKEFEAIHTGKAMTIRRAVAHGAFRRPADDTGHEWIFGEYVGTPPRHVYVRTTRMSSEEFTEICRKFLAFRLAFFDAVGEAQERARLESSSFQAANQMKPDEILDCRLHNGGIHFTSTGTQLW